MRRGEAGSDHPSRRHQQCAALLIALASLAEQACYWRHMACSDMSPLGAGAQELSRLIQDTSGYSRWQEEASLAHDESASTLKALTDISKSISKLVHALLSAAPWLM